MRAAIAFLTVLPVGSSPAAIGRGTVVAFPLVGLVVGLAWWLAAVVGIWLWGPFVAATLVLTVDLIITGGLHLDGLADVADGIASRREGEDLREVLADPHVGGIGAAALVTALLVRLFAIAAAIADAHLGFLVLVPVIGRVGMLLALAILPLTAASLTSGLAEHARGRGAIVASVAVLVGTLVAGVVTGESVRLGAAAVLGVAVSGAIATAWRRRHGFASGDVVGASGVLAELSCLLALAAATS